MAAYRRGEGSIEPIRPLKRSSKKAILIPASELPFTQLGEESVIDSNFSNHVEEILEDEDQSETVDNPEPRRDESRVAQTAPKEEHPHYLKISRWVRDAGLGKQESADLRKTLFGDRWKKWREYTDSDMRKLESTLKNMSSAKKAMTSVDADDDWSDIA